MSKHKALSINDVVEAYRARQVMEPIDAETHAHLIAHRILEGMDEPNCEFGHRATTCTRSVTHRASDCDEQFNLCQGARASIEEVIASGRRCRKCQEPAAECWRIWSI